MRLRLIKEAKEEMRQEIFEIAQQEQDTFESK
jgi:hypothetical protein